MRRVTDAAKKPGFLDGFRSWRLTSISLLSISSALPLGVVWMLTPFWLKKAGLDIKTIGFLTLAQAPWGFKFLWSPLMDRYHPKILGRKRGWILITQLVLAAATFALASQATTVTIGAVAALTLLIAFAGASQDIAYDAYAVEVLDKSEHGAAVGARTAMYRFGLWISGNIAISAGPSLGWGATFTMLAVLYVLLLPVTIFAPEPASPPAPVKSLKEALWEPFVGFLGRPQALQITAFVALFRLADSLGSALTSPYLVELGYSDVAVGVARGTVVLFATIGGTLLGGWLTHRIGVSRSLWITGFLQAFSNLGYALIPSAPTRPWLLMPPIVYGHVSGEELGMFGALGIEALTSGMGWGAFGLLLLRLTEKRFSATQYALFSSLVGLTRALMGPIAGILVDGIGWKPFFAFTVFSALPGMILLHRFCPWGVEPSQMSGDIAEVLPPSRPYPRRALVARGVGTGVVISLLGVAIAALLSAVKRWRVEHVFDWLGAMRSTLLPAGNSELIDLIGAVLLGLMSGLAVAAYLAARGQRNVAST